ncbi:SSS family solute:Na+ symporter [Prosthecobacter fusiformis]|uniref:SSS family solute:Na+ symporter n=1 Tax=Prosthecobacter fusiformis TaxID=48464 RepID=A0A4R7SRV5_9BACT|nr:sodium/solute symporter [Prosthecobacter fusiformis]TDU81724.1 SSS family solute:Na+ symporter [Prosthecobacter fusiformis]
MNLHWVDLLVIIAYFAVTLTVGLWFTRKSRSTDRYYLGGRNFPGWAVGLSFIGGTISSMTFIGYPADSFKTSWVRLLPNLAFPFVALLAAWVFIPFFRQGKVTSAYQYLHLRFGAPVAAYAACVYMAAQIVRMATITYLLAVLLASLSGLAVPWCIVLAAGLTGLYATIGGFEAVIWTEVLQTVVLILGALVCVVVVLNAVPGGFGEVWSQAMNAGKISFDELNVTTGTLEPLRSGWALSEKTMWMLMLVGASQYIAGQLDQDTVQRWCSAKSVKEARKSMVVLGLGALPVWTTFMFLGTCLWVYYQQHPDAASAAILAGSRKSEDILPHFILTALPVGMAGLVVSAALAAGMSSLGCCVSAASMVWVNDIQRKYLVRGRSDGHYLRSGKIASAAFTLLMMGGAVLFHLADTKTIMDASITMTALFGGGISGAFLFGMFTRAGDHRAVLVGIASTVAFTGYALLMQFKILPRSFDPYYTSILANGVMLTSCALAAKALPAANRDLSHLTIWDRPMENPNDKEPS